MKDLILKMATIFLCGVIFFGLSGSVDAQKIDYKKYINDKTSLNVYNWGEFLSDGFAGSIAVNKEFEKLTGIKVNYSTFASNEELYAKMRNRSVKYDIIIPSDYMVARMIKEGLLLPLDFNKISNYKNIDDKFKNLEYDKKGKYSVPYMWGTVGIIYNSKYINRKIDSWASLWDESYKGKVLMFSNARDCFGLALKKLNYSLNTERKSEILEASAEISEQKRLVQAYVMDEIFNKMENEEAIIAPYYSGAAITMINENPDLRFVHPKEGTNQFIDAICIPNGAQHIEQAYLYINFLLEPEIALSNCKYAGYSTPNKKAYEMLDQETKTNKIAYPDQEVLDRCENFLYLSSQTNKLIDSEWIKIMSLNGDDNKWFAPALILFCVLASLGINIYRYINKKR